MKLLSNLGKAFLSVGLALNYSCGSLSAEEAKKDETREAVLGKLENISFILDKQGVKPIISRNGETSYDFAVSRTQEDGSVLNVSVSVIYRDGKVDKFRYDGNLPVKIGNDELCLLYDQNRNTGSLEEGDSVLIEDMTTKGVDIERIDFKDKEGAKKANEFYPVLLDKIEEFLKK